MPLTGEGEDDAGRKGSAKANPEAGNQRKPTERRRRI